jgi:hypothetical protein
MKIRYLGDARFDLQDLNSERSCKDCVKCEEKEGYLKCNEYQDFTKNMDDNPDNPLIVGNFCKHFFHWEWD